MITVTAPEGEFIVRKIAHLTGVLQHALVRDGKILIWETPWGGQSLSSHPPFISIEVGGEGFENQDMTLVGKVFVRGCQTHTSYRFENQDMTLVGKGFSLVIHERGGIEAQFNTTPAETFKKGITMFPSYQRHFRDWNEAASFLNAIDGTVKAGIEGAEVWSGPNRDIFIDDDYIVEGNGDFDGYELLGTVTEVFLSSF